MILQVLAWVFAASTNCIVGQANDGVLEIGDFVEMSVGREILGGVAIPEDVVVGAGALVIKTVEDRGSVMGVPAKVLSHHVLDEHERRKRAVLTELAKW